MCILQEIIAWPKPLSPSGIADVLDEKRHVVENVLRGPMRCFFKFNENDPESHVLLCHKSFRDCVLDPNRSGQFLVQSDKPDDLFRQILSRPSPNQADTLHSYSQDNVLGVLQTIYMAMSQLTIPKIASVLNIQPQAVYNMVRGPRRSLFVHYHGGRVDFPLLLALPDFLEDENRSGYFFISRSKLDDLFIQILSRTPFNSHHLPTSLLDVFLAIMLWSERLTVSDIASVLDVDLSVVPDGAPWTTAFIVHHE